MSRTLHDIGVAHGTDQSTFHDYLTRLEPFFVGMRQCGIRLLEIGVAGGASLRTWAEYFPNSEIYGIDHTAEYVQVDCGPRVKIALADASRAKDWEFVEKTWPGGFDIIIDDASHSVAATMAAFSFGWPSLRPGGIFVLEDLHAGYLPEYRRDNKNACMLETDTVADRLLHDIKVRIDENGKDQCGKPTTGDISFMHFTKSLVIIGKRK